MKNIVGIFLIASFSICGMEKDESYNIIPKVGYGLRYNLAAHQECKKHGISSEENDAFIHLHVYLPCEKTHRLSIPLCMLLDEHSNIKEKIILPQFNNGQALTVKSDILQKNLETMISNFNNMCDAYDPAEKDELIKKNILREKKIMHFTHLLHGHDGFKLPIKTSTQKILEEAYIPISQTAQDNKITSSYNWVVGIGALGLISFLVWLYKK